MTRLPATAEIAAVGAPKGAENLRVLHVIDSLWGGGAEVSLVEYLRQVVRDPTSEHRVIALRGDPPTLAAAKALPIPAVTGPPGRRPRWSDHRRVRTELRSFRPDVVHAVLERATIAAGWGLRGTTTPLLVTLTSVTYEIERRGGTVRRRVALPFFHSLHGTVLRRPRTRVRGVSPAVVDRAVQVFGIDPKVATTLPDLVGDPRERVPESRSATRSRLGIGVEDPVLIYPAREHPTKDHVTLLRALRSLATTRPRSRLILAGSRGPASDAIDRAIHDLGLEARVLRLGHREDVPALLSASDLFVSTSLTEGLGVAAIEALAMRTPIVAVDNPGMRFVLGDDHPGLVRAGDPEALAHAMDEWLVDSPRRAAQLADGRTRFEELFEANRNSARLTSLLRSTAARSWGSGDGAV